MYRFLQAVHDERISRQLVTVGIQELAAIIQHLEIEISQQEGRIQVLECLFFDNTEIVKLCTLLQKSYEAKKAHGHNSGLDPKTLTAVVDRLKTLATPALSEIALEQKKERQRVLENRQAERRKAAAKTEALAEAERAVLTEQAARLLGDHADAD